MSDLSLHYDELDDSFHEEVRRLAAHFVNLINVSAEWPAWKYEQAVDNVYEGALEAILDLTVESLEDSRLDRVLEDRAEQMAHNRFLRGAA